MSEPTVSVSLTVSDTAAALDFYTAAFGAQELFRMPSPDGGVFHAEFMLGNSHMYISDPAPSFNANAMPEGTMAASLLAIAVDDCDAAHAKAIAAGGTELAGPTDQFWGVRSAMILDAYGYRWSLNQRTEEVSPEEIARRAAAIFGG